MFLRRFASLRSAVSSAVHHLLLCGPGLFRGVVSFIVSVIAVVSSSAKLSIAFLDAFGERGRGRRGLYNTPLLRVVKDFLLVDAASYVSNSL